MKITWYTIAGALIGLLFTKACCAYEGQPDDYMAAVTYCGIPGTTSPTTKGWLDYGLCDHGQLARLVTIKTITEKSIKITYKLVNLENRIYNRTETGLDCNFSVYKCTVEAFK